MKAIVCTATLVFLIASCSGPRRPHAVLIADSTIHFNNFVDCNMAEAWVGDRFRIFPGKYGEDPVWGYARELKFADGKTPLEAFQAKSSQFQSPSLPLNALPGTPGLHGAVWFETIYQDPKDGTGNTLYAVYHNENYPETLPYDSATGKGYLDSPRWPTGLTDSTSVAAVCRIGIMKSTDGGKSWTNKGIFIEDHYPRMILKPDNNSLTFAGGVGDPSAVVSGDHLYLFYGEYGYPGVYSHETYNPGTEWSGQCISVARIPLAELDSPEGKAKRWSGRNFSVPFDSIGKPIPSLQIPMAKGGGPASSASAGFFWGPSVSWNEYLQCWVMLMGRSEAPKWVGGRIYISFNLHADLAAGNNSQDWTEPELLLERKNHILWYPSLQPQSGEDVERRYTCLRLGQEARLFFKDQHDGISEYLSEYKIRFEW